jgi:hypothetical protein
MLTPTKLSWKKLLPYLAVMIILTGLIFFLLLKNSGGGATDDLTDESVAEIIPEIASLLRPQFDIAKLKNFDIDFFKDPRLFTFTPWPDQSSTKPTKGKNNPFLPYLPASSTVATTTNE